MGEYRNENWVKLWAQIELPQVAALYTTEEMPVFYNEPDESKQNRLT